MCCNRSTKHILTLVPCFCLLVFLLVAQLRAAIAHKHTKAHSSRCAGPTVKNERVSHEQKRFFFFKSEGRCFVPQLLHLLSLALCFYQNRRCVASPIPSVLQTMSASSFSTEIMSPKQRKPNCAFCAHHIGQRSHPATPTPAATTAEWLVPTAIIPVGTTPHPPRGT